MALIELEQITKEYRTEDMVTPVLAGVTFRVSAGEFVSIMGPSGSGKSTLMHIIGFLDRPTSGQYRFEGRDTANLADDELANIRNKKVGFVFQAFHLLPRTTALENVELPLLYNGTARKYDEVAREALEAVGLGHRLLYMTSQLSGGEKQRVAIARALVNDPAVLFADEPTGNLDSKSGLAVMSILQRLNNEGRTIILVTHDTNISRYTQRIIYLQDGMIVTKP